MSAQLNQYRDNAIEKITNGKTAYNNGTTYQIKKQGYDIFKDGVSELLKYSKLEQNESLKKLTSEKINQYITELEQMKNYLSQFANQSVQPIVNTPVNQTQKINSPSQSMQPWVNKQNSGEERKDDQNILGQSQKIPADVEKDKLRANLEGAIVTEKPNVKWDDVAGLENAKKSLQEAVILPIKFPEIFQGARKPWMGILLYGPPGTGKTFLAKACATECDGTFFSVSSSDLISKFVGESERLIKSMFQMARERKPCIIFIDEIDSMCGSRDGNDTEASRRVKTEFLVQMQGVGNNNDGVLVLGATNLPWALDPAIRRRFERRVYIPLPDSRAILNLLQNRLKDTPTQITTDQLQSIAEQLNGYSGSDLNTLIRDASFEPLRKCERATTFKQIKNDKGQIKWTPCSPSDSEGKPMKMLQLQGGQLYLPELEIDDFLAVIPKCRPSVDQNDLKKYEEWTKNFGQDG